MTAEVVNREVLEALDQLRRYAHNTSEQRRLAACHMLKELAGVCPTLSAHLTAAVHHARGCARGDGAQTSETCWPDANSNARLRADSCPAVFNVHVRQFVGLIWSGLRDPKLDVRNAAVAALRACLILVEQRETRYRVQWWYNLFEQTMRGVVRPYLKTSERDLEASVHASLLTLGELLQHSGEFMLARCAFCSCAASSLTWWRQGRRCNTWRRGAGTSRPWTRCSRSATPSTPTSSSRSSTSSPKCPSLPRKSSSSPTSSPAPTTSSASSPARRCPAASRSRRSAR